QSRRSDTPVSNDSHDGSGECLEDINSTMFRNRWRDVLLLILTSLTCALISGRLLGATAAAAEPRKMTVPYTPLTGASAPLWIAIEARIFQKYGLEITPVYVAGSNTIVAAMTSGQFEIAA